MNLNNFRAMRRFLIFFVFLHFYSSYAQTQIDSLTGLLEQSIADTTRINVLNELSVEFRSKDPDLGLRYAQDALELSSEIDNQVLKSSSLNNIGVILELQGNLSIAMEKYMQALKISREAKDDNGIAKELNNIGIVYKKEGEHQKAIKYYKESLNIHSKLENKKGMAICLNNLGLSNKALNQYEEAGKYYAQCLDIFIELNHIAGQAVVYNNLGIVNKELDNKDLALEYFNKSLKIREGMGSRQGIAVVYNNIGELYSQYGEYDKAIDYLSKSIKITKELGFKDLLFHNYGLLDEAYFKSGGLDSAYHYLTLLSILKDTLNNQQKKEQLRELEVKFETENKEREIEVLEKEKLIQNEQVERQKWQILTVASGLGLSLIVVLMIYINMRSKSKSREEIIKQKRIVDVKNQEITDSITYAKRIQKAILPSEELIESHFSQSFVLYKPKDIIAGDFYWLEKVNGKIFFAVADCTGHGVPGAMVSMVCSNALTKAVLEDGIFDVAKILDRTREIVIDKLAKSGDVKDGMDISLACFNFENMKLEWAGANNPLYLVRNGEIKITKGDRQSIGFVENLRKFTMRNIDLNKGDAIYFFTDGFADQFGGIKGKKLGYKNFREKLLEVSSLKKNEQKVELEKYFNQWQGAEEQVDDVCIVGIRV